MGSAGLLFLLYFIGATIYGVIKRGYVADETLFPEDVEEQPQAIGMGDPYLVPEEKPDTDTVSEIPWESESTLFEVGPKPATPASLLDGRAIDDELDSLDDDSPYVPLRNRKIRVKANDDAVQRPRRLPTEREALRTAVAMTEILGPPLSKRHRRRLSVGEIDR